MNIAKRFFEDLNTAIENENAKKEALKTKLAQSDANLRATREKIKTAWNATPSELAPLRLRENVYKAEYEENKAAYDKYLRDVSHDTSGIKTEVNKIRGDLRRHLDSYFALDPSELKPEIITMISSGMLKSADMATLAKKAIDDHEYTLARYIASAAFDKFGSSENKEDRLSAMDARDAVRVATDTTEIFGKFDLMAKYGIDRMICGDQRASYDLIYDTCVSE